ncbi:competence protein ComF [Pontibacillus halophilus JSM 076056 = DSM 19796]|uniref:Competence protein ComF n=1 Tax=Pontibacillus halophilus JSM 076056 = DSM 19796 TaxID=1385510 RepID=A0A0A5GPP1_9BACI|nr:helicase-related protein [Pontibacillus halophilus]KGX93944.1 competence protein ComF [Pontibacillus halophilus JSM 076056 = DSM 19796]
MTIQPPQSISPHLAGKLLVKRNWPFEESLLEEGLQADWLSEQSAITNKWHSSICHRCGTKKRSHFYKWPCPNCGEKCVYCRSCVKLGRLSSCDKLLTYHGAVLQWKHHQKPCMWEGKLTRAQQQAADAIVNAVRTQSSILVWAVCGAGKTEMLFPGIAEAIQTGKRVCLATPRADVVRELLPRLRLAFPHVDIVGRYGGSEERDEGAQFVVATTHQLFHYRSAFDVMIIDEVDAFPYHADPSLPRVTSLSKQPSCATIYLTATPREDLKQASQRKNLPTVFVPIRFHGHPLPVPTCTYIGRLSNKLQQYRIPNPIKEWIEQKQANERRILLFAPTVTTATHVANELSVPYVHAEHDQRKEVVQQFRNREVRMIVTTTILERGVTFPSIDVAVLDAGHRVFDEAALVQIAGRAGRSADDPSGNVVFFHDGFSLAMDRSIRSIRAMNKKAATFR